MEGKLVILSGPSGVGKDALIELWRRLNPRVARVVAATTREPRPGEVEGVDYRFLSEADFEAVAAAGGFLEHKLVHGRRYGTPLAELEPLLAAGRIAVLKIDVQGGAEVLAKRPDAASVFILPPSLAELELRLRARGTEGPEALAERLRAAEAEIFAGRAAYGSLVVNDELERAAREVDALVG